MADGSTQDEPKRRADAERNRERLLATAKAVFSVGGPDASLEAVAGRAGLGIGTLYRHFPTREALFEAVYRREVEQLGQLAETLAAEAGPVEALRRWVRANMAFVATKKGMSAALALAAHKPQPLTAYSYDVLSRALGALLRRAEASGEVRGDVSAEEVLRVLLGIAYTHEGPGWQATVTRLADVFIDGLQRRPGTES